MHRLWHRPHRWREIRKLAAITRADLLVLGTHGRSGARASFFGSTMEHSLRNSPVPLLAVPLGGPADSNLAAPLVQQGPVIAPIDFSPASIAASRIARGIASALGVPLVLMHVSAHASSAAWQEAANAGAGQRGEVADPQTLMADLAISLEGTCRSRG